MTPEGKVKKQIKEWLKAAGAYQFWPVQTGMGMRTIDLLCCYKGHFVGIEVKAPGKKPTALQLKTIMDINRSGGWAFWCSDLQVVKSTLAMWFGVDE